VTVSGGLSIPVTTPAHGTAFDITEKNIANMEPTINSFQIALNMSQSLINGKN
jgi:4-hydroxythreonine-4-phosphate dehydrogenase